MICIACPNSKNGKTRRHWPYWQRRLAEAEVDAKWIETERPGHATELACKACGEIAASEPIVAVGGDGTINEVLNGLLAAGTSHTMGVLYAGTSPDFCRFHRIPIDTAEAVETLLAGKAKAVDTVRARHRDASGKEQEAYFACSSNVGLGAAVARFSNRYRKFLGDTAGTLAGVLRAFLFNRPSDLMLELDGREHHFPKCNHLMLVKNPHIASGLRLDLPIDVDDGQAYAVVVHGQTRLGLCRQLPKFYTGRVADSKAIFIKPFRHAKVWVAEPKLARSPATGNTTIPSQAKGLTSMRLTKSSIEVEYDGDPRGFLPLEVELMPRSLNLIGASDA